MAGMIYFDGNAMEIAAPVRVVDIVVGGVEASPITRDRPIRAGATFIRNHYGIRSVIITFALLTESMMERARQIEALMDWARSEEPKKLELPNNPERYLMAVCTSFPEPSARKWWENNLSFTFTCYDPFWYDVTEKHAECGNDAFYVGGSGEPLMRIEDTLSSAAQRVYSDGTDTMTFTLVPAGDLVVDLNNQTAAVGGVSCMDQFTFASTFIQPKTGTQTITGSGTVYWRERWL